MRRLGAVDLKARGLASSNRARASVLGKLISATTMRPRRLGTPIPRKSSPRGSIPTTPTRPTAGWRCKCPAHNGESHTSLVIKDTAEGPPGWHCFADCPDHDVAAEIAKILA